MGKSAPRAPDYRAAAEETAASNREALNMQTYANRINQYNPWGSLTYDAESVIDPATGQEVTQWTQNQQLSPEVQQALDKQMRIQNQRSGFAEQLMQRAGASLLREPRWGDFTEFAQVPQAFGSDGSRRVNPRPMYRTPNEVFNQPEEIPQAEMPTAVADPSPQSPTIPKVGDYQTQPALPSTGGGGVYDEYGNPITR